MQAVGTVCKPLAVFHGFHSRSEGEKGEVAFSLRWLAAALWLSLFSLKIRDYANHYATIKKWLDEDAKGRSAKNYTYDDNEGECL